MSSDDKENTSPAQTQARVMKEARKKTAKAIEKKAVQLKRLVVEYVPITGLKPNAYNPNRQSDHDFELLIRSMREDGFTQPVVAIRVKEEHLTDKRFIGYSVGDVVIVDGEHRWRAATALGYTEIPVVITSMTPEQMRIATLRHNRARGSEDIELAAEVLKDLQELGAIEWAQDSLMLDDLELERLLEDVKAPEHAANAEFSDGWQPGHGVQGDATSSGGSEGKGAGAANVQASMSAASLETARKQEQALAAAKTAEEKAIAAKDFNVFRLSLVFSGTEAVLVKSTLGLSAADALVALCRHAAETGFKAPAQAAAVEVPAAKPSLQAPPGRPAAPAKSTKPAAGKGTKKGKG